jgi:lysophospholipase L1-like esterase
MEAPMIRFAFVILALIPSFGVAKESKPYDTTKWKAAIDKFLAADEAQPTEPGGILFVGSSSIVMWDLEKSFPGKGYLNRGFGGSEVADSVHYFSDLVTKHKPRLVVFYAGDNDIAAGKSPEQVHEDFQAFTKKLGSDLPDTKLIYIAIKPSIARWKLADKIREANALIKAECEKNEKFTFLDVWPVMLNDEGEPREDIFLGDGLHVNDKGYEAWVELIGPELK